MLGVACRGDADAAIVNQCPACPAGYEAQADGSFIARQIDKQTSQAGHKLYVRVCHTLDSTHGAIWPTGDWPYTTLATRAANCDRTKPARGGRLGSDRRRSFAALGRLDGALSTFNALPLSGWYTSMDPERSLINLPSLYGIELRPDRGAAICTLPSPCPSFPDDGRPRLTCLSLRGLPAMRRMVAAAACRVASCRFMRSLAPLGRITIFVAACAEMDATSEEHAALVDGFVWVPNAGKHSAGNGSDGFLEIIDCDFPVRCRSPTDSIAMQQHGACVTESP